MEDLAGRSYIPQVYPVLRRDDVHSFLIEAIRLSGGTVLYSSGADRAPVYLGVQDAAGQRVGLLVYPFRMTKNSISNRPNNEVRGQIRYGRESSWAADHPLAKDLTGVDVTLVLGVYVEGRMFVGLQPTLYDPLPMGISFYAKDSQLDPDAHDWVVWEHQTIPGSRRGPRVPAGLETVIGFAPDRLLDYALFERQATDLELDQPLRFSAARAARVKSSSDGQGILRTHALEAQFQLSSEEILELISTRNRLQVAVRGGVAEHHLERILRADPTIASVVRLDLDSVHDFDVMLSSGETFRIECKNASPERYANGEMKVEVQKTRASKNDPRSRFYRIDQFDVVAACIFSSTGRWEFRYSLTSNLQRHSKYGDRLAPLQRISPSWRSTISGLAGQTGDGG